MALERPVGPDRAFALGTSGDTVSQDTVSHEVVVRLDQIIAMALERPVGPDRRNGT